jgi:periplasmic protein CpxP/Spy
MRVLLAVLAASVAVIAAGCHRGGHREMNPERVRKFVHHHVEDVMDDFDANQAQRAKAAVLEERLVTEAIALHAQSHQARQEALSQLRSPTPDAAKLHALLDERFEAYRKLAHQTTDALLELHATLTPQQREKLDRKLKRFSER